MIFAIPAIISGIATAAGTIAASTTTTALNLNTMKSTVDVMHKGCNDTY